MRSRFLLTISICFLALFGFYSNISAQETANQTQQTTQNAEIMGENDSLPFMQNDRNSASAEPTSGGLLLKTLGSMFLIIGLLFVGAWGAKKYGLFGAKAIIAEDAPDLKIMSSVTVANGQMISAVRFGERVLLVGSTANSFTLLAEEFDEDENLIEKKPKSVSDLLAEENASFGKELKTAQNRLNVWNEKGSKI